MDNKISNVEIFNLLQKVSSDLKNELALIKEQLNSREQFLEEIKIENLELREANSKLENRVKILEKRNREKNLVIYNIEEVADTPLENTVINFLATKLQVTLDKREINNVYRIGKQSAIVHRKRPILLKLVSFLKKHEIVSKLSGLKGTGISVSEDLSPEDREKRRTLYMHYRSAKASGYPAKLYGDRVLINGIAYKYSDLKNTALPSADSTKSLRLSTLPGSTSAPASPARSLGQVEDDRDNLELGEISTEGIRQAADKYNCVFESQRSDKPRYSNQKQNIVSGLKHPKNQKEKQPIETRSRTGSKSSVSSAGSGKKNRS